LAAVGIDDAYVADLRAASSGSLQDDQIETLLGSFLKRYALRGNLDAARGTPEWRKAARGIAEAELQVLSRMYDRDEGVPAHEIAHPPHLAPLLEPVIDDPFNEPLSLRHLLEQHLKRLEANGGGLCLLGRAGHGALRTSCGF
jgi:hypothetical protein